MTIVVPALDRDQGRYADLSVLVSSLKAYAPDVPVLVAYAGARPALFVPSIRQAAGNCCFGDACRQLRDATDGDLLVLNDDTVLTPDTLPRLEEDLEAIRLAITPAERRDVGKIGLVGLRTNYVAWSSQNIRWSPREERRGMGYATEDAILVASQIFGVAFWISREALREAGDDWTRLHWYSDNLLSYDLRVRGFQHFVSRAYVHHHGSRSGGPERYAQWDREAKRWLLEHRPDFCQAQGWSGGAGASDSPPTPA